MEIGRMFSGVPSGHDLECADMSALSKRRCVAAVHSAPGDAPNTLCLANFRLSLWDETIPPRNFSTVHGKSRTTKPRPARQSGSLSGRAQTSRRRLRHDATGRGRNINANPMHVFSRGMTIHPVRLMD
jgi:hypothetical protein